MMARQYFRGRIELGKLSHADLADAAAALAVLERLAERGLITFKTGWWRNTASQPGWAGKQVAERPRLQRQILQALAEAGSLNWPAIQAATGMKEGSLSAHLTHLEREGMIVKQASGDPERGRVL